MFLTFQRDAAYDDREAVFFLTDDFWVYGAARVDNPWAWGAAGADDTYYMDDTIGTSGSSWWDDTIDVRSRWNRLWLPSSSDSTATGDSREYLLALPGYNLAGSDQITESSTSTISLGSLKVRIAAVNANLNGSEGTAAERRECWKNRYNNERYANFYKSQYNREPTRKGRETSHSVESGASAGTAIFEDYMTGERPSITGKTTWLEGEHSSLFEVVDDTASRPKGDVFPGENWIIFSQWFKSARPLPSGVYNVTVKEEYKSTTVKLCNEPESYDWTVTANAPGGVLHEFFFDPVTVGSAVGADSTNGVLKPTSFTGADGATSTVSSMAWEPASTNSGASGGQVKLLLTSDSDPDEVMGEHILDFIALDGSVSLSLDVFDATVDSEPTSGQGTQTHTLSWTVSSQPWESGDELMVRVRKAPRSPVEPSFKTSCPVDFC